MIRINLIQNTRSGGGGAGQQFLLLMLVILIAEGAALFYLQSEADAELLGVQRQNKKITADIKTLRTKTDAVSDLEDEKEQLERQKAVLKGLEEGQSGPVKVLYSLTNVLRRVEDPEEKLKVQNLGWNPDWEPKNLWIDGFKEQNRGLKLFGHARTNEDLAEFLHRLNSSKHFANVELRRSLSVELPSVENMKFVQFEIDALALYGPADALRLANGELTSDKKKSRR